MQSKKPIAALQTTWFSGGCANARSEQKKPEAV
jgi:hypothetical protein